MKADQEINRKRGRREHRNNRQNRNQISNPSRRGDISVIHGDCDGIWSVFALLYVILRLPVVNRKLVGENEWPDSTCQEAWKGYFEPAWRCQTPAVSNWKLCSMLIVFGAICKYFVIALKLKWLLKKTHNSEPQNRAFQISTSNVTF